MKINMIRTIRTSMIQFHVYVIFDKHEMHMNILQFYIIVFFLISIHYMYLTSKSVARLTA